MKPVSLVGSDHFNPEHAKSGFHLIWVSIKKIPVCDNHLSYSGPLGKKSRIGLPGEINKPVVDSPVGSGNQSLESIRYPQRDSPLYSMGMVPLGYIGGLRSHFLPPSFQRALKLGERFQTRDHQRYLSMEPRAFG